MGFSFRGKGSSQPELDGQSSGHDVSAGEAIDINPEADLKKFKKLHKWDPFMDIDKLDAADEFVTLFLLFLRTTFYFFFITDLHHVIEYCERVISRRKLPSRRLSSRRTLRTLKCVWL